MFGIVPQVDFSVKLVLIVALTLHGRFNYVIIVTDNAPDEIEKISWEESTHVGTGGLYL